MDILGPILSILIICPNFQVSLFGKAPFSFITKSLWIMQVSLFSSVLINGQHCRYILYSNCMSVCTNYFYTTYNMLSFLTYVYIQHSNVYMYLSYSNCSNPHVQVTLCSIGNTEIFYAVTHLFKWSVWLIMRVETYIDLYNNDDNGNEIFI